MMRSKKLEFETTIEIAGAEVDVTVEARYLPGTSAVMHLSNGDPGHPGDPPEPELLTVYRSDDSAKGDLLGTLDEKTVDKLCEQVCEKGDDAIADDDGGEREYDPDDDDDTCGRYYDGH
jgi:hypothetical protein